ncbi:hypothetical protein MesoLj131a_54180 [Mesorhizobium sp. 131-2-1]|nr:hypothetical protein MesoLj131a_54180 [Mesorhizobium sp. 131-2-1]
MDDDDPLRLEQLERIAQRRNRDLQHFDKIALRQKGPRGDLPLKQRLENSRVGTIAKALARCCSGGRVGLIFVLSHFSCLRI